MYILTKLSFPTLSTIHRLTDAMDKSPPSIPSEEEYQFVCLSYPTTYLLSCPKPWLPFLLDALRLPLEPYCKAFRMSISIFVFASYATFANT